MMFGTPLIPAPRRGLRRNRLQLRACHGFSLLELTLVVTIIAVLGALAAPRFANAAARQRLEAAARRVVAELQHAQTQARANSADCTARFAADHTLTLIDADGTVLATTALDEPPYDVQVSAVLDAGGTDLTFNGFGYPDTGGSITLSRGNNKVILDIDPVTGGVTRR